MTERQCLNLDFSKNEVYVCGAALVTVLAFPSDPEDRWRPALHASLCAKYLRERYLGGPDEAVPVLMTPIYALRAEKDVKKDIKTLGRRLRDRMVAAHIAMGFIQRAAGQTPKLPPDVSRLSLNELTAYVSSQAGQSDPGNTESRVWRPSLPVIHLAAATAISINDAERGGHPRTSVGDILHSRQLIEDIVNKAQAYENLINNNTLPIDPSKLIKLRLLTN